MATLILTAVGTAIGGPVGGAIGALIGQQADRAVLGPRRRQGPRLTELAVQTSSYGTQLPKLFGTMRVAGTVIWATDLIETQGSSGGGKGRSGTTTYSYAASFAVALSGRPILAVKRIWADGKLLRGAAGDWKAKTGFRFHLGGEDQPVDPMIASAEGIALTPAHRGQAYAVFEQLALADFGNRIPSLTFEVVADPGAVASGAVVRAMAGEVVRADAGLMLDGFAASGGSVRAVIETLAQVSGARVAPVSGGLAFRTDTAVARMIEDAGYGAPTGVRKISAAGQGPASVTVAHHEAARDYQAGLQRARRGGGGAVREERVEVPAVIDAGAAKAVAEAVLARREAERVRRTVAPGLDAIDLLPGDCIGIAGEGGRWRVAQVSLEAMAVTLDLVRMAAGSVVPGAASGGRVLAEPDAVAGRTRLAAFEVPALDDAVLAAPRFGVVATGEGAGWRRATLLTSGDDGVSWDDAGVTAMPGVLGVVEAVAPVAPSTLADLAGAFVVRLARDDMLIFAADDAALDRGANLALVGDELVQFGAVADLGSGRWRLSRLLRGRRGTEAAAGLQAIGDRFVLLSADTVRTITVAGAAIGATLRVLASGVGDEAGPVAAEAIVTGASVVPPSIAQLGWVPTADGGAVVRWVRRSRAGWRWVDGVDAPLIEEVERYRVTLNAAGTVREMAVGQPQVTLSASERPVTVTVRQQGTHGESGATTVVVPGA